MTELFLKAKHWHLFLVTFGIPIIFQFVLVGSMMSSVLTESNPDPTIIFSYMKFYPIVMIILLGVFFGWFWAVVTGLQTKIPEEAKMKLGRFKIFFFIPLIYMLFFSIFIVSTMVGMMSGIMDGVSEPNPGLLFGIMSVIMPLHLFSMFCIFHSLYFVAKTFKTVELQRSVTFSDFAGEFFLIWFYPIGIWILQPKINQMVDNEALINNIELI